MYKILRFFLFKLNAETAHHFTLALFSFLIKIPFVKSILQFCYAVEDKKLERHLFGLTFKNPVGLAAGLDKNAACIDAFGAIGFGFIEIGTVTPLAQPGNDKPRLFRLIQDEAIINRMGFNNDGADIIVERLKKWQDGQRPTTNSQRLIIGGNIGKNKVTPNEEAWKDYEICFKALHSYVDYFVVNVSSPNTPGLRELQEKDSLRKILTNLQSINKEQKTQKPVLLKIAPDLTEEQIDDVIDLALEIKLDGLVATNTTISRDKLQTATAQLETIGAGGLSGLPVRERSTEIIKYIYQRTNGQVPIIASGGIFTGEDAKNLFNALPKIENSSSHQESTGFVATGKNNAVYIKCSMVNKDIPVCTIKLGTPLSTKQFHSKWTN